MLSVHRTIALLLLLGCGACSADPGRRPAPTPTPASTLEFPSLLPVAEDGRVTLHWPAITDPSLAQYNVYWGQSPDTLTETRTCDADTTQTTIEGLDNGVNYFFALDWQDAGGGLSERSTTMPAQPFAPDLDPPTIITTTPIGGALAVDPEALLSVTFSEPMDTASIALTLTPARALRPLQFNNDGSEVVCASEVPFREGETYAVEVTGRDVFGNPLAGIDIFTFTVGYEQVAPTVVGASPEHLATDVPTNARVTITFNEPMEPVSTARALSISPDVSLSYEYDALAQTIAWMPTGGLAPNTEYLVTLGATARSARGNTIADAFSFSFTTSALGPDETAPTVTSFLPEDQSLGADPHFDLTIAFSEPMDYAWAQAALVFLSHPSLTGSFEWTHQGTTMHFRPDTDPDYGEVISWKLLGDARDLAGNAMGTDVTGTFRVVRQVTTEVYPQSTIDGQIAILDEPDPQWGDNWIDVTDPTVQIGAIFYTYLGPALARSFFSFDLHWLPEELTKIDSAFLVFHQGGQYGTCENIGGFYLQSTHVGLDLTLDDYDYPTLTTEVCDENGANCTDELLSWEAGCSDEWSSWKWTADVTLAVQSDWDARLAQWYHSQYRLRQKVESTDAYRSIWFYSANSSMGNRRPTLTITYEIP